MRLLTRTFALVLVGSLLLIAGCDTLNTQPLDELSGESVWNDPALTKNFLASIYSNTGVEYGDPMQTPGQVDEAVNIHGHGGLTIIQSNMTPSNRGIWSSPGWRPPDHPNYEGYYWPSVYGSIRDLNLMIENVQGNETIPADEREVLLGEAYFLRAFFYHNLMKKFGGVPVIDEVSELSGDLEQYQTPRNTFGKTIEFIVADLDRAADRLSLQGRRLGAATRGAALALKSRVLLHAASDLHDASASPFDMEELVYTSGSQMERWQRAKDAAQAVIDLGAYSLDQTNNATEYHDLAVEGWGSGMIWARHFSESGDFGNGNPAHNHSLNVSPNGYNCWTGDAPTQQHVDAYEMADGSEFEWDGADPVSAEQPVDAANPYENRDPRFEANILFNNAQWRPRPAAFRAPEGGREGIIQTGFYEMPDRESLRPGLDTRGSPNQQWNGTKTGYNLAKFIDRSINPNQEFGFNSYVHLRYAEVLLNFAEAAAELGQPGEAVQKLNMVRSRVGMPGVPIDGGPNRTLMERIRQEREVELAFEGHRYFDVRRWLIGEEAYQPAMGIRVVGRLVDPSHPEAEQLVVNWYNYEYNVFTAQERQWDDKNYFVPIPLQEMERNPQLVQNPGYGR